MKCYYTQRTIRKIMIGFAIIFTIASIILAIIDTIEALFLLIFSGVFFLGNEFGKINRILIDENYIDVKMPVCRGKYTYDQLKNIIIAGESLKNSSIEIVFQVNEKKRGCQFEMDIELLKDLLKKYSGKITLNNNDSNIIVDQLKSNGVETKYFLS